MGKNSFNLMRQFFIPVLSLLLFASCDTSYKKYVRKENSLHQTIRFMELSYGIGTTDSENTEFKVDKPTDTIPLELGKEFGIRYSLESNVDEEVPIRTVWTFPDSVMDEETETKCLNYSYSANTTPNASTFASYVLGDKGKLVAGKWFVSIYYDSKLLYRKVFFLKK